MTCRTALPVRRNEKHFAQRIERQLGGQDARRMDTIIIG